MASAGTRPASRLETRRHRYIWAMVFVFVALRLSMVAAPYLAARPHSSTVPQSTDDMKADDESSFPEQAQTQKQCGLLRRRFFVSGTGTVQLRTDGYVSRRVALTGSRQEIDLPQMRPTAGEVQQHIVLEGKADLVVTTDLPDDRLDTKLDGTASFDFSWTPLPNC